MLEALISSFWAILLKTYGEEDVKEFLDALIDKVEERIEESETKLDDWALLPPIAAIREYFDLPDNDEEVVE